MVFRILLSVIAFQILLSPCFAQAELEPLLNTHRAFESAVTQKGIKPAFLEFLQDDATVFQPGPVNGRQYWMSREVDPNTLFVRNLTYSDIAANGLLGY